MLFLLQGVHRVHSVTMTKKAIIPGEDHVCILLQNKFQQHTYTPDLCKLNVNFHTLNIEQTNTLHLMFIGPCIIVMAEE